MKITAVIMAGGKGERFWPRSRKSLPKQFLSLTGTDQTMIQLTVNRLLPMISWEDIYVVTNAMYYDLVKDQLAHLPESNILLEPMAKNTAPAIGLAAAVISSKYDDAVMLVLASDHVIKYEEMFLDTLAQAVEVAQDDENLVTIGIMPTYPETGYGYINFGRPEEGESKYRGVYAVKRFVEKPNVELAKEYLASGQYLWNSGMFVWKVSSIMHKFQELMPQLYDGLMDIKSSVGETRFEQVVLKSFSEFPNESIDYGIMEQAKPIYTIPGTFGWDDVGSWLALERINKTNDNGNVIQGDIITIETKNTIICGNGKLMVAIGLEDLVIVDTQDATLICDKNKTQYIKKAIENLRICNREEYL